MMLFPKEPWIRKKRNRRILQIMWNCGPSCWTWLIDSNQCLVLRWTIEKGKGECQSGTTCAALYWPQLQHGTFIIITRSLNMCLSLFMFSSFHRNVSSFKSCCVPLPSQCTSRKKAVSHIPAPQVTLKGPALKSQKHGDSIRDLIRKQKVLTEKLKKWSCNC